MNQPESSTASSPPLENGISDFGYLSSPDPSKMTVFVPMLITAVDIAVKHICKILWSILTEPQWVDSSYTC